jgi:plasmid stabilization system protein ParE
MGFRVEVSPEAPANLDAIARHIRERGSFESAERWFNGIINAIRSLSELPRRCALAEESEDLQTEVRLLLHGKRNRRYKIYFAIRHEFQTVSVFHVRHWAMKPAEADELGDLMDEASEAGNPT